MPTVYECRQSRLTMVPINCANGAIARGAHDGGGRLRSRYELFFGHAILLMFCKYTVRIRSNTFVKKYQKTRKEFHGLISHGWSQPKDSLAFRGLQVIYGCSDQLFLGPQNCNRGPKRKCKYLLIIILFYCLPNDNVTRLPAVWHVCMDNYFTNFLINLRCQIKMVWRKL